jgi:hypothetical protein
MNGHRGYSFRFVPSLLGLLVLLCVVSPGCQRQAPVPSGELAVRLLVVQGPDETTLALVPVYIEGEGPFTFALDTGASHTVVDQKIAERLQLPVAGPPVEMTGVAAVAPSTPVRVEKWRVGKIEMPPRTMVALDLTETNRRFQLQGLLGSDILSRFGAIQVDYDRQLLILHPKEEE